MGQIEDESGHKPWEARAFPMGHPTHYEKGYVYEAMSLMREHRVKFDEIIRSLCTLVNESQELPKAETITEFWTDQLAEKMLSSFIKDNSHPGFTEEKIREIYSPNISNFFSNIHKLISNISSSLELEKLSFIPIKASNINMGWTALLREFGLFSTMSDYTYFVINRALEKNVSSNDIRNDINTVLPDDLFKMHGVQCPAANQVKNHLLLNIGLNAGLIERKIYSNSNHISFLENDEMNHFKSIEKMCAEYESKIKGINTL